MPPFGGRGAGDGQESVGRERQDHVAVPAIPAPDLVVIQADPALGRLGALLDRPPRAGHADRGRAGPSRSERRLRGRRSRGLSAGQAAPHQQPMLAVTLGPAGETDAGDGATGPRVYARARVRPLPLLERDRGPDPGPPRSGSGRCPANQPRAARGGRTFDRFARAAAQGPRSIPHCPAPRSRPRSPPTPW